MARKNRGQLEEPELAASIALIDSARDDSSDFGSGFLIHGDDKATYWLTCAHVINDIGNLDDLRVDNLPAQLVGIKEEQLKSSLRNSFDLAVLKVEGLFKKKPLKLAKPTERELNFLGIGHFQQKNKRRFLREIAGSLHVDTLNVVASNKYAWVLDLELNENFSLEPGYSGSPVFIPGSQRVIGVVEQRQGQSGRKGQAIAVDAAISIFQEVPELRNMLRIQTNQQTFGGRFRTRLMESIERPLRWAIGSEVCTILDWLLQEGISTLAKKASDYALNASDSLNSEIQRFPEEDRSRLINDFQWELEKYLERIYGSFLTDSQDLLEKNKIRPTFSHIPYEMAFSYIKTSVPENITEAVHHKLDKYVAVLIKNLYVNS